MRILQHIINELSLPWDFKNKQKKYNIFYSHHLIPIDTVISGHIATSVTGSNDLKQKY